MANEVQALSTDIHVITAEINAYQRVAGEAIFEIGKRLKHVKENDLAHGEFGKWLESVNIHERQAQRLMKVADEFGGNTTTWSELPFRALYEIATLPSEERTVKHELKNGETKLPKDMTMMELAEVKAELKRKQAELDAARLSEQIAMTQNERLSDELAIATKPETVVVEKEVERIVEVDKTDYSAVEKLKQYEERFGALENYSDRVRASNVDDVTTSIISFNMAVRDFIKRHAYLIKYQDTVGHVDKITQREYVEAVSALKSIAADFGKVTGTADYVDVEFSEVQ